MLWLEGASDSRCFGSTMQAEEKREVKEAVEKAMKAMEKSMKHDMVVAMNKATQAMERSMKQDMHAAMNKAKTGMRAAMKHALKRETKADFMLKKKEQRRRDDAHYLKKNPGCKAVDIFDSDDSEIHAINDNTEWVLRQEQRRGR